MRRPFQIAISAVGLGALALAVLMLGPGTSGALETNDGCPNPDPIYRAHDSAHVPQVFYIGDSISANADQKKIYADKNWAKGWKTLIIARGGAKIQTHRCLNWLSFYWAHEGNARAVVVELGTNDIYGIYDENYTYRGWTGVMPPNQRLTEIARVFTQMNWVANYLDNKCVVWVGLNHYKDSLADDKDVALAFDRHLTDLASNHPNLHYASYATLVRDNATFQRSLYGPPWSGRPEYGTLDTIHPLFPGRFELGAWVTRQVDHFCI
jgi:hypothetical protein